jgi:NRPS condensation-like uncharacterized protein
MTVARGVAAPALVPLSLLDEHFLNLDHAREPWGVHLEVRVGGRVDPDRLREAIAAAVRRHPMARAQLAPWSPADLLYRWEIVAAPAHIPLTVVDCPNETDLVAARERLFAVSPSLDLAPPFAVVLARRPAGDSILMNLHHAAGDGVSAVRLMRSILRAYAGEEDPVPAFDPLGVRDVQALAGADSLEEQVVRHRALALSALRRMGPITRVAREGGDRRPGYGFELMAFSARDTAAVFDARGEHATINDVLLAGLAVAVRRWNAAHGRGPAPIALTMPVNVRPPAWRDEVVGNFATYVSVWLATGEQVDVPHALAATAAHTRRIKEDRLAGMVIDLLVGPSLLPVAAKRRLQEVIPLTGNKVVDTASLSNLGALDGWPALGARTGGVEAVWFTPPARAPLGAAIGAVTVGGRLQVAIRYPRSQFGRAAARAFAQRWRDVLVS